jgi:hypothetical protein
MKVDELLKLLDNVKIDENKIDKEREVYITLLTIKNKGKEEVIRYIFDSFTPTNKFNSIFYVNNGVKYFSRGEKRNGIFNIIINGNKAYDWASYDVKNDTIIVYVIREYTVSRYVPHLLVTLPETPVTKHVSSTIADLYNYLRRGYKIEYSEDPEKIKTAKALAELTSLVNIIAFGD